MRESYANVLEEIITLLFGMMVEQQPDWVQTAGEMDRPVQEVLRQIGRTLCERLLNEASRQITDAARAEGLTVEGRPTVTYFGVFGPMSVESPRLRDRKTGRSARPVKDRLGVRHQGRSQAVERAMTDFGAEDSFGRSATRFTEHYGWSVHPTTVRRVTLRRAHEAEAYVTARLDAAGSLLSKPSASRPGVEVMLTELDGCEIRTGTLEAAPGSETTSVRGQPRRQRDERWREVRVGLARPLEAITPLYVARMASYPEVVGQLFNAAVLQGLTPDTQTIAVADGGNGLKEALEEPFAGLTFILDRPHLCQHLYETAEAIGLEEDARKDWVHRHIRRIDAGGVREVLAQLRAHRGQGDARVRQLVGYLTRFRECVHYDDFKARGFPIGSGEVESAHRTIPQKRLKLSGACWHPESINPMLGLRVMRENGWWPDFWFDKKAA